MSRSIGNRFEAALDRVSVVDALVALGAGAAAVAGSYAVAGSTPAFVGAPVSEFVTRLTPGVVVAVAIQVLGSLGQLLVLLGAVALVALLFALVAGAGRRVGVLVRSPGTGALVTYVGTTAVAWVLVPASAPALAAGVAATVVVGLADLGRGRTGATAREAADASGAASTADSADAGESDRSSAARRSLLRAGVGALAVVGLGGYLGARRGADRSRAAAQTTAESAESAGVSASTADSAGAAALLDVARERSLDVPGLEGLISSDFYQVDINGIDPDVAAADWSLRIVGGDAERTITYDDLRSLPAEHRFVTLRCVGEPLNGKKMDTALWTGVPVADLLGETGLPETCCVTVYGADDYYQAFPLSALRNAFVAYGMNGKPLPRGHGRPARLLVPGHWGEINMKWLTGIEATDEPAEGYWEKRGWHGTGPVNTVAKLHAVNRLGDGRIQVGGHAYAGTRGIDRVEVSVDGGETWTAATLSEPLPGPTPVGTTDRAEAESGVAEDAWRMWTHEYVADGRHRVVVRAVDGTGTIQPKESANAFPSGASGWVTRRIAP